MIKKLYIYTILLFSFYINANAINSVFVENDFSKIDSIGYYLQNSQNLFDQNKFDSSLDYAEKARKYAIRNSLKPQIAETYYAVGTILLNQKEYEESEKMLKRCISVSKKFNKKFEALANYKLAILYAETSDFENAELYFSESEKIYQQLAPNHAIKNLSTILIERAYFYEKLGKINEAKALYHEIIEENRIDNNTINAYIRLANIVPTDSISWSITNLEAIKTQYPKINPKIKSSLYLSLGNLYIKQNSNEKATFYLRRFVEIENATQLERIIDNNLTDYNSAPVNENIAKTNGQSIQFIKLMSIMGITAIAILSLLSLSLYRSNKERSHVNNLLQNKNSELEIAKDKAEKASKARSEFLSTVSHELRTPLNAINGITHILLEEDPKESQLQYLKSLEFSGDYLLRFINDILEINRVESGNVQLEEITYDIRQLLENITESFSELARANEISCSLEIDNKIPPLLIGDPTKLSQIFMNLIGNAMKFSKKGSVTVSIRALNKNPKSMNLLMEVKDTGIGIPPLKQAAIFDNFTQGSVEINRKYGGTGLGLAIVKSLVQLLGGEIKLESKVGVGSRFYFIIEQHISAKAEIIPIKIDYDDNILIGKHVLIVEDNKINQMITEKMISKKGMTFKTVENGTDAITVAKNEIFDLILMDIHLPGINGTIAAQEIRKFNKTIPIIALTAISLNENREAILAFGMNEVITKPFQSEKFYQTISQVLNATNSTQNS